MYACICKFFLLFIDQTLLQSSRQQIKTCRLCYMVKQSKQTAIDPLTGTNHTSTSILLSQVGTRPEIKLKVTKFQKDHHVLARHENNYILSSPILTSPYILNTS